MLTFLGDVALIDDSVTSKYKPRFPYILNCENVFGRRESLVAIEGKINLIGNSCDYSRVFGTDPVAVTLANNHSNDFGNDGFKGTVEALEKRNIKVSAGQPIQIGGIWILSYMDIKSTNKSDNMFLFDKNKALEHLMSIKKYAASKVIVVMHWGIENNPNPNEVQIENAHWLIDNGVDLIIGHHPHCVQRVEKYKGKLIFYSLGNSLFPNINQQSHYDSDGNPTRIYRFKWQKWNRTSYAVTVDNNANVVNVEKLYQTEDGILRKTNNVNVEDLVIKRDRNSFLYYFRKYYLFIASNCFVDGKIIDLTAVKAELTK